MVLDLDQINNKYEKATPSEILAWAWDQFDGRIAATSSFQSQSMPLLHLITVVTPNLPVLFLDTGFHFPETIIFRDKLIQTWGLRVESIHPEISQDGFHRQYGDLYRTDPDLCCQINKVEPMQRCMKNYAAWVSGIRRDQTKTRSKIRIVELQPDGIYKISPLANWTQRDIWQYIHDHDLLVHPLTSQGYLSIGCAPCTRPILPGEDERAGRWAGTGKIECGLHQWISDEGRKGE